jgi:hypothetical protein
MNNAGAFRSDSVKGEDHFEDLSIGGRVILNLTLNKKLGTRFVWLMILVNDGLSLAR